MNSIENGKKLNQADSLPLQLKEAEKIVKKLDPKKIDLTTFIFRYRDSMVSINRTTPDKYKTKTKLEVIEENKKEILKYDWNEALSAIRMFLNKEQFLLGNPGLNPDIAKIEAYKEEAKHLENDPYNPSKRALSKKLKDKVKKFEKQASQKVQKTSAKPKETIFKRIKKFVR